MGRFILSVAVVLAVVAPCGAWAVDTGAGTTTTPSAQTTAVKPKAKKPASVAAPTTARKPRKTTGGTGASPRY